VCNVPDRPTIYHVGTYSEGKLDLGIDVNVPRPVERSFEKLEDLFRFLDNLNPYEYQGLIGFSSGDVVKILHDTYLELFKARGNEPSIKFQYLKIRMDFDNTNNNTADKLRHLYTAYNKVFDEYENIIYEIAKKIFVAYVKRFIKKAYIILPTQEYAVMTKCHSWHQLNYSDNKVNLDVVIDELNSSNPSSLNQMIKDYKNGQDESRTNKPRVRLFTNNQEANMYPRPKDTIPPPPLLQDYIQVYPTTSSSPPPPPPTTTPPPPPPPTTTPPPPPRLE